MWKCYNYYNDNIFLKALSFILGAFLYVKSQVIGVLEGADLDRYIFNWRIQ